MAIEPSKRANGLETLTYQNLLLGFREPSILPFTLNDLKVEFHKRVKNRLFQHCLRFCQINRFDDSIAKEIFQKTILKAFDNVNDFDFENAWSEEKFRNKVAAWLNKIAYNLFIDMLKERSKYVALDEDYNAIEDDGPSPDDFEFEQDDMTQLKLQDALDSLNERERFIVNKCIEHNCLDNKDHLPDDVISDICRSLKIKKGNIRVIKLRALKKMRTILKKN
jgi:RNA polymerase sigma factor (sigma-70 family)